MIHYFFLENFELEVRQIMALITLSFLKQGKDEVITSYILIFELVVIRFVRTLLSNDTFKHFFIQRFAKEKIIKEILYTCSKDLIIVKYGAKKVEKINKEHRRLWHKKDYNIHIYTY